MIITLTNADGTFDVTGMISSAVLSGEVRQCCRTLDLEIVSSPYDDGIPAVDCSVGAAVSLFEGGALLFSGFIFSRTKTTVGNLLDLHCYDRGIYLKKNQTSRRVDGLSPEQATADICAEYGIPIGEIAKTGATVRRIFVGATLYEIIASLYTEAAKTTGKAYQIGFDGDRLTVWEKGPVNGVLVVETRCNLTEASTTESAENMVNRISIQDADGKTLNILSDEESIRSFGLMGQVLQQSKQDVTGQAKKLLEENAGVNQRITVGLLGGVSAVTGDAVLMHEDYTGLYGIFYIDADTHTWKNGIRTSKLTLNLKAVMDEVEAGKVIETAKAAASAQTTSTLQPSGQWEYPKKK